MLLNANNLRNIPTGNVDIPGQNSLELPERVLQFGTGVLLRALPDYFIDKANRSGIFNGRIIIVKSTGYGHTSDFDRQDNLYTLCVRGLKNGALKEENIIISSISKVFNAQKEWSMILECAQKATIQIIISNTTEVGLQLKQESIWLSPPESYPGKLLAFLYERYRTFEGSDGSGMVIVPTELVPNNGKELSNSLLKLAEWNHLEHKFLSWLLHANTFCNSLVDRIVPGKPEMKKHRELEGQLGYEDELMIISEPYGLWAIQGSKKVKSILSFADADNGVIICEDINVYTELKLRLLNGTHTFSCGVAFLSGFDSVKQAMEDRDIAYFIKEIMQKEIIPSIPFPVNHKEAIRFSSQVLDRFGNPYLQHDWINITVQYSYKIKLRCIPVLLEHYRHRIEAPMLISFGFAAYLHFMRPVTMIEGNYFGCMLDDILYPIQDDQAETFYKRWEGSRTEIVLRETFKDQFWGVDLSQLPGFAQAVAAFFEEIQNLGMRKALKSLCSRYAFKK